MTRALAAALLVSALVLSACGKSSTPATQPADIWAGALSQNDVRTLLGDPNWWAGPPSFQVSPLDAATTPLAERFAITQDFLHVGTAEEFATRYTVYDTVSSATSRMTDLKNAFTGALTSPRAGDDVLYLPEAGGGGAPYAARTYVRVSQVVVTIIWTRKDPNITLAQLAKNAGKVADGVKKVLAGKVHGSFKKVNAAELPPPGRDITLLGATRLPIQAWVVMTGAALMDTLLTDSQRNGVTDFTFGDYALNNDTHMEVQTALLKFPNLEVASSWASLFVSKPDPDGIDATYVKTGGSPAAGEYHYYFVEGLYGAMLICKPSLGGEAASRECEDPLGLTAIAWKAALRR